jgi:hypothetical protein
MVIHSMLPHVLSLPDLVKKLAASFRPGGMLLLWDLFVCEGEEKHHTIRKWQSSVVARLRLTPWLNLKHELETAGFEVHVQENMSRVYASAISTGLHEYLERVTDGDVSVKQLTPALSESQKWMTLQRALKAGSMEYWRVTATFRG